MPWKYKPFVMPAPPPLEKDLPPGVEYKLSRHAENDAVLVSLQNGHRFWLRGFDGHVVYDWSGETRGDFPVVVLVWPEWCGPRPDQPRPITYADVREQAPTPGSNVVLADRDGGEVWFTGSIATIPICGAIGDCICLGYHYWEPDND